MTLVELLIVTSIVGLFLFMALPQYTSHVLSANRRVGVAELLTLRTFQERFYAQQRRYALDFVELGYSDELYAINQIGEPVSLDNPRRIYRILLSTQDSGFTLNAIPQLLQAKDTLCRTLSIDARGVRRSSGEGDTTQCW